MYEWKLYIHPRIRYSVPTLSVASQLFTLLFPPHRIHPNQHLQSVFLAAETLCLPCDFQGEQVHNCWQRERVSAALQEHSVLRWLLRGDQWSAQGWHSWWGNTNWDNWIRLKRNVHGCRVYLLVFLLQLVIKWRSIAQIQPAGPRGPWMVASLSVCATQICATATSPGAQMHVKNFKTPHQIIKVSCHICGTCSDHARDKL